MKLDPVDEQIIKESKAAGAVFVTWDRVLLKAAGGLTPIEAMDKALEGPPEARAEVSRLIQLKPFDLTALAQAGNKTYEILLQITEVNELVARLIRHLRVEEDYSWRAVARIISSTLKASWGSNQIAGMVLCMKAARLLGEDFMEPPWN